MSAVPIYWCYDQYQFHDHTVSQCILLSGSGDLTKMTTSKLMQCQNKL